MSSKDQSEAQQLQKPPKRTPAHGGGQLYVGGVPGNKGGTGAPPSALRARMREIIEGPGLDSLEKIARGEAITSGNPDPYYADVLKAIDIAAKFGLGEAKAVAPDEFCRAVAKVFHDAFEPTEFERRIGLLLDELKATV